MLLVPIEKARPFKERLMVLSWVHQQILADKIKILKTIYKIAQVIKLCLFCILENANFLSRIRVSAIMYETSI